MKHLMWGLGVNPLVIPNGLGPEAGPPEREAVTAADLYPRPHGAQ